MSPGQHLTVAAAVLCTLAAALALGQIQPPAVAGRAATSARFHLNVLARDVLAELIAIDTTSASGSATRAAEALRSRLLHAGFPPSDVVLAGPGGRKQNLVGRYRGAGSRPPLLLLAHADVVDAGREGWTSDPFTLSERGGFFYGRGTIDMKDMAATFVSNLAGLKAEGYRPDRDIIFALTADEEGGDSNGVEWLLRNRRALIDASICLTEGGGGQVHGGRYAAYTVQAAEKAYVTFSLEARGQGGHSAVPGPDNAIHQLASALTRVAGHQFPAAMNDVTRSFFARMGPVEGGSVGRDMSTVASAPVPDPDAVRRLSRLPYYSALLRTTCAATSVEGGHAENALPQKARALVNCRLVPGASVGEVERALAGVVADPGVSVAVVARSEPSDPSPLSGEVVAAVEEVAGELWPGVPVIPSMGTGTTDGRLLRQAGIATYGVGPFRDIEDNRAHGPDERIGVKRFYEEREFLYRLIKKLTGG